MTGTRVRLGKVMLDDASLRFTETACRFAYPPTFRQRRLEFFTLVKTEAFRAVFPNSRLIGTHDDIWGDREADPDLPEDFIPFLIVGERNSRDYYGFPCRLKGMPPGELPVLVWAIHAYVQSWDAGFSSFLEWVSTFVASSQNE